MRVDSRATCSMIVDTAVRRRQNLVSCLDKQQQVGQLYVPCEQRRRQFYQEISLQAFIVRVMFHLRPCSSPPGDCVSAFLLRMSGTLVMKESLELGETDLFRSRLKPAPPPQRSLSPSVDHLLHSSAIKVVTGFGLRLVDQCLFFIQPPCWLASLLLSLSAHGNVVVVNSPVCFCRRNGPQNRVVTPVLSARCWRRPALMPRAGVRRQASAGTLSCLSTTMRC